MHLDELDRLEGRAVSTLDLKRKHAQQGHDWVVDAHTLTSCQLLELVALARLGWPIWKEDKKVVPSCPSAHAAMNDSGT